MASKRRNMFHKNKTQETTEEGGGAVECGVAGLEGEDRILGGLSVDGSGTRFPWYVGLSIPPDSPIFKEHPNIPRIGCGGSLIDSRHVLTAAHCFRRTNGSDREHKFRLAYLVENPCKGDWRIDGPQPERVIIHPLFDSETLANDIAIIRLEASVPYTPICLPRTRLGVDEGEATVIGYGSVVERRVYPCILQEATLQLIPRAKCLRTPLGPNVKNLPRVVCAGRLEGGVDTCDGDSGGPLQVQGSDGRYTIRGIVSFGVGCGRVGMPGIYTDVSAYMGWIRMNTGSYMDRVVWSYNDRLLRFKQKVLSRLGLRRPEDSDDSNS